MAINKVEIKNSDGSKNVLIDISDSTVTADTLLEGTKAYGADGEPITGSLVVPKNLVKVSGEITIEEDCSSFTIDTGLDSIDGIIVYKEKSVSETYSWFSSEDIGRKCINYNSSSYLNGVVNDCIVITDGLVECKRYTSTCPIKAGTFKWIAFGLSTNGSIVSKKLESIEVSQDSEQLIFDTGFENVYAVMIYAESFESTDTQFVGSIYADSICAGIISTAVNGTSGVPQYAKNTERNTYLSVDGGTVTSTQMSSKYPIKAGTIFKCLAYGSENSNGGIDTSDATATASDILKDKTAYVNGVKITGTHECDNSSPTLQEKSVTPSENAQTVTPDSGYDGLSKVTVGAISKTYIGSGVIQKSAQTYIPSTNDQTIASGQYLSGAQTIKGDSNLIASNIKKGVSIFDVLGTYEASGGSSGGLAMKSGTTTSGTIETGLSNIKLIIIYKGSLSATGLIQGVYITDEDTLHYTYCSQYSSYFKTCAVSTSTASSVSGGTFTLGTSGTSGLSSRVTYNWIAIGEE